MDNAIRVSIAELLEVRADGLYAPELLSIIVASCEHLQKQGKYGVFNLDYVFLTSNGEIEMSLASPAQVPEECVPPELRDHIDDDDVTSVRESQMVWCLGDVANKATASACTDGELISLFNLMTIHAVNGRPSVAKVGQMARNKCSAGGIEVVGVLRALYEEVMGDIDDLMEDDLESSTGYSGVNGAVQHPVLQGVSHAVPVGRDMPDTPPSTSTSDNDEMEDEVDRTLDKSPYNRGILDPVIEEENSNRQATKIERRFSGGSSTTAQSTISEGTLSDSRRVSSSSDKTLPDTNRDSTPYQRQEIKLDSSPELVRVKRDEDLTPTPTREIFESKTRSESTYSEDRKENDEIFPVIEHKKTPVAQQIESRISEEVSEDDEDVPPPRMELPPSPKLTPKNSPYSAISARKKSRTGSMASADYPVPPSIAPRPAALPPPSAKRGSNPFEDEAEETGTLSRHNSLEPGKVRRSSRRKGPSPYYHQQTQQNQGKRTFAVPEFVDKPNMAVIRLQAQGSRKKRLSLHRIEATHVLVRLINGQVVEVNCKSDGFVGAVFDTVVEHFKLTEYSFFGLSVKRDGEHFFLDNEQRLEKYAPPGWKNPKKMNQEQYQLSLRFRCYPKKIEFIKTQAMIHSLYLQLRQDLLTDALKPSKDKVYELAALALQAEFGDHPPPPRLGTHVPYFQIKNYLPARVYMDQESARIEKVLSEIHSHYAGLSSIEAERQFIEACQKETEYGAHFYKIYKFKPASTQSHGERYSDSYWVAILPDGIGICSQQGSVVAMTSFYQWHMIRTLQFDRKRFLVSTVDHDSTQDHVFYTDHYTKSGYLVKFAASQHRFMMKMRQWQSTLQRQKPPQRDVEMDRGDENLNLNLLEHSPGADFALMPAPKKKQPQYENVVPEIVEEPAPLRRESNQFEEEPDSDQGTTAQRVNLQIVLEKDPIHGLGLTLVDGVVGNVKGVYVKSVSSEGDARRKAVETGDCIQAINDVSLVDKTRHDAVELVKASEKHVKLDILRFPQITQIISHERQTSKDSGVMQLTPQMALKENGKRTAVSKIEMLSGVSRTPPAARKTTAQYAKQRAVSDFGAIGDGLPVLNSEDLLAGLNKNSRNVSTNDSEDEHQEEEQKGEYKLPITSVYNFHVSDDEDEEEEDGKKEKKTQNVVSHHRRRRSDDPMSSYQMDDTSSWVSKSTFESNAQRSLLGQNNRQNLDWTHELSDIEDSRREGLFGSNMQKLDIIIHRLGTKSLGFQVATANGFVYVKAVSAEPAISADLRVDDRILFINTRPTSGMSHQEVVDSLRTDRSPIIKLTVERAKPPEETERTITVTLEKSANASLGLSLAKRMGHEGIFVRNIAVGSIADRDGRLRVGDRVYEIDGGDVADKSTNEIVEKLKSIEGRLVEIVVKRAIDA